MIPAIVAEHKQELCQRAGFRRKLEFVALASEFVKSIKPVIFNWLRFFGGWRWSGFFIAVRKRLRSDVELACDAIHVFYVLFDTDTLLGWGREVSFI